LRFLFNLLALIGVALTVGFGLSWYALSDGRLVGAYRSGAWVAWPAMGSPQPDPYARAALSRNGSLQLGFAEGLQFSASADDDGQPLRRECDYRLEGLTPVAAFWTLVAVDGNGVNVARPDGALVVSVGKRLAPFNWLELTGDGPFQLSLTLYDTSIFAGAGDSVPTMPSIRNLGCA
jgi:hypothetical protein